MATGINRSFVPRIAVENTVRRGIEMHEAIHGTKATPDVIKRIREFVLRQANILNLKAQIQDDEMHVNDSALYGKPRRVLAS